MDYTINTFQEEMENCNNPDEMNGVIEKLLDSDIDFSDKESKELLSEYRKQIEDYRKDMHLEMDAHCNKLIEDGRCELYTCIKDNSFLKKGNTYYVKIDDVKSKYLENVSQIKDRLDPKVLERINSVKGLATIIYDSGIGTLKQHKTINEDKFKDYFEKY